MKRLAALATVGILALAGCSNGGDTDAPSDPQSTITVVVANQAGVPLEGVAVGAQQSLGGMDTRELPSTGTTDASGKTTLTLPVNVTASVWLSKDGTETRWQNALVVPNTDITLYYQYPVTLECATVDPTQPSSCPAQPAPTSDGVGDGATLEPTPEPAPAPTPTPTATQNP